MMAARSQQAYIDAVNAENQRAFQMSQRAREAERTRQKSFEDEQVQIVDTSREDMSRESFDEDRTDNAAEFMDRLAERPAALQPTSALTGTADASDVIKEDRARTTAKAAADARERITALANLTGYADTGQGRAVDFVNASDRVSTIGGLRRGSLGVANQEQQIPAATVTPGSSTFADILSGVGGMLTSGVIGGGLFGGAAGATGAAGSIVPTMRPIPNPRYPTMRPF
jgi:hypothetical protein